MIGGKRVLICGYGDVGKGRRGPIKTRNDDQDSGFQRFSERSSYQKTTSLIMSPGPGYYSFS